MLFLQVEAVVGGLELVVETLIVLLERLDAALLGRFGSGWPGGRPGQPLAAVLGELATPLIELAAVEALSPEQLA